MGGELEGRGWKGRDPQEKILATGLRPHNVLAVGAIAPMESAPMLPD